jgi:K+-transporting ATPase ATPase A chain
LTGISPAETYVPETTVGIFVQITMLAVQNFLSAAVGIVWPSP